MLVIVTPVTLMLIFCPTVPLKVSRAFWPGEVRFTVTDDPLGVMGPVTSPALYSASVMLPV